MVVEPVVVVKVEPEAETTAVRAEVVIGVPLWLPLPFIPPAPPMPPALEEPIIPLLVDPALAPEPVAVMDMEPEPAPARGTVADPALEEPLAEARATVTQVRLNLYRRYFVSMLTLAVACTVCDGLLGSLGVANASLVRAIADTVAEVDLAAEAGSVGARASELHALANHAVNASLLGGVSRCAKVVRRGVCNVHRTEPGPGAAGRWQ